MTSITLFYDESCPFCRAVKKWLDGRPKYLPIHAVPYASPEARQRFPGIAEFHPEREILALADDGGLYIGGDAWILCLWATRGYRAWARRLSSPALRPMAKRIAGVVAAHRYELSAMLLGQRDHVITSQVAQLQQSAVDRLARAKVGDPTTGVTCECALPAATESASRGRDLVEPP